jgi:hypothetical protein
LFGARGEFPLLVGSQMLGFGAVLLRFRPTSLYERNIPLSLGLE